MKASPMTLMLASVSGPQDAEIAIAHGADIIDLRDPDGAFAPVSADIVRATVAAVNGRRPVSAIAGQVSMEPAALAAAAKGIADAGADYVEVGLVRDERLAQYIEALREVARRVRILGVVFADEGFDPELIALAGDASFAGVLLHTPRVDKRGLLDVVDIPALADFIETARAKGLLAGFAGALEPPDIPRLLLLAPDILGCGGLCTADTGHPSIDEIRGLISGDAQPLPHEADAPAKVDYRLLAARAYPTEARKDETDRVFVHDFVLPVRIGTYARERAKPQDVRFSVDARVLRATHSPEDMRDVFSYDIITDSIRMIVAQDHIPLVEMLAERIAAVVLAHPRVVSATVRVEKLNVGPGSVGVEITRDRPAEAAQVHRLFPAVSEKDKAT
jgi:dihydroneopterin aldolase